MFVILEECYRYGSEPYDEILNDLYFTTYDEAKDYLLEGNKDEKKVGYRTFEIKGTIYEIRELKRKEK